MAQVKEHSYTEAIWRVPTRARFAQTTGRVEVENGEGGERGGGGEAEIRVSVRAVWGGVHPWSEEGK